MERRPFRTPVFLLLLTLCLSGREGTATSSFSEGAAAVNATEGGGQHDPCDHGHETGGIHLVSFRWEDVGVYYTITAFVILAGLAKLVFHEIHWLSSKVPESCLLIVLGVLMGFIVYFLTSRDKESASSMCNYVEFPQFTSPIFFFLLLPPIILESAYSLHDRTFFDNLSTILMFAVVGTLFNIFTIGPSLYGAAKAGVMGEINITMTECLVFSSLISAVDPVAVLAIFQELGVNKCLYFLVFGESLLNDGITVVVYNTMNAFAMMQEVMAVHYVLAVVSFFVVIMGGIVVGVIFGFITAFITKITTDVRVMEPLAVFSFAYLAYLTAELFHFSGIISLIVCGLVQAQFAFRNISSKSYTCVKYFTKMASATSDTIIFMFLGMVLVSDEHVWHTGFILWTLGLCFVIRFVGVFMLAALANHYRIKEIHLEEQFIAAYGGLRGAIAFSLVTMLDPSIPYRPLLITTTLVVILFTVFVQGITIRPLVDLLKIQKLSRSKKNLNEEISSTSMDHIMAGIEEILGQYGDFYFMGVLRQYNEKYFNRWLLRPTHDTKLTRLFEKITVAEHFAHLYGPVAMVADNKRPICSGISNKLSTCDSDVLRHKYNEILLDPLADVPEPSEPSEYSEVMEPGVVLRPKQLKRRSVVSFRRTPDRSISMPDEDSAALRKAFRSNPYNKLHYKHNLNMVNDDEQEMSSHMERRLNNARRLTRLYSTLSEKDLESVSRPSSGIEMWTRAQNLMQNHRRRSMIMRCPQSRPPILKSFSLDERSQSSPPPEGPSSDPAKQQSRSLFILKESDAELDSDAEGIPLFDVVSQRVRPEGKDGGEGKGDDSCACKDV